MSCAEIRPFVDAYFDGELDLVKNLEIEGHLKSCSTCSEHLAGLQTLHQTLQTSNLNYRAPESLERRWLVSAGQPDKSRTSLGRWKNWVWQPLALTFALVVLTVPFFLKRSFQQDLADEIISNHVRSLMAAHLTDVASTNQHTVKPWFAGKIDFAPTVRDLKEFSFPLVGGRLDYVKGHSAAALVYRSDLHTINLFVWPSLNQRDSGLHAMAKRGYNLINWTHDGMTYWAISDLNSHDLMKFSQLIQTVIVNADH